MVVVPEEGRQCKVSSPQDGGEGEVMMMAMSQERGAAQRLESGRW